MTNPEQDQLRATLEACRAEQDWMRAVAVIARLVELAPDDAERAALHLASARMLRDELGDTASALEQFSSALDVTFGDPAAVPASELTAAMEPFRAITAILTEHGDLKSLDRQHRNMLARLRGGPHPQLEATLYDALVEIYRALGHDTAAEAAAEQAKQLRALADAAS